MGRTSTFVPPDIASISVIIHELIDSGYIPVGDDQTKRLATQEIVKHLQGKGLVSLSRVSMSRMESNSFNGNLLGEQKLMIVGMIKAAEDSSRSSPTYREMCEILGICTASVKLHVDKLVLWGVLERDPGRSRSLRITESYKKHLRGGTDSTEVLKPRRLL